MSKSCETAYGLSTLVRLMFASGYGLVFADITSTWLINTHHGINI